MTVTWGRRVAGVVAGAAAAALLVGAGSARGRPASYRELRLAPVVAQSRWYTCGPAAVATLLSRYLGRPTTELEVLEVAARAMQAAGRDPSAGISLAALRHTLHSQGVDARGVRTRPEALRDYFEHGGLPVILHVTRPRPHYVVAVGLAGGAFVLADPSFGLRLVEPAALVSEKGFEGVALVPLPAAPLSLTARLRQSEAVAAARRRMRALRALQARLP